MKDGQELVDSVDAIVFTGGPDFDPVHYGQEKHDACGDIHPIRDKADLALMQAALTPEAFPGHLPGHAIAQYRPGRQPVRICRRRSAPPRHNRQTPWKHTG